MVILYRFEVVPLAWGGGRGSRGQSIGLGIEHPMNILVSFVNGLLFLHMAGDPKYLDDPPPIALVIGPSMGAYGILDDIPICLGGAAVIMDLIVYEVLKLVVYRFVVGE